MSDPSGNPAPPPQRDPHVGAELARLIFNNIRDGVFTVDLRYRITSFNPAAERITGFTAQEAIGRPCFEVFRADICNKRCALRDALSRQSPIENARVTIINRESVEIPISVSAGILRNQSGDIFGAVEFFHDLSPLEHLQARLARHEIMERLVSGSPAMNEMKQMLPNVASSEAPVLIQGPSGSGKEVVAQAIHSLSARRYGPYVRLNCGALPEALLESELFGYAKGAFTDATRDKPGHFALAGGGTLLLDEISEMSVALQVKLLRVLNNGEYQPLGATKTYHADARILASTNADLKQRIEEGRFRDDLYYRINVVTLELPPLRERLEDIPLLIDHFLSKFSKRTGKHIHRVSPTAMSCLKRYSFPGNVRELENAIEHAFVMCDGDEIQVHCLPQTITSAAISPSGRPPDPQETERRLIEDALRRHYGNRQRAASELGMHRSTLWRKMRLYGLDI
jgi:PAS domain S-box-containing protein